ncbi:MAG: CBS domain-containing protein [Halorhodospira halophila]|uniref:CBS domain-containing protein n=1 Tax=Halorhodospira TaxID=85108 RepID=UPI001913F8E2|nr:MULTISPECIES: CBS domain-containing protein [Halorhodospira]MBK5944327.1 histidine kinase [Halorhodospira halophila]MCC3750118.1 CBS domain-containing protein [Halorhodospira halophila]MCG5527552.1 CBS domain-containing protein [Halorhodospira halophila]MCG5533491.1 CBS domain-containing protein [Halorhodospira sp. 9621]MCG5538447.1 CBS domain-containing protein [Halorhodospira sp. 9622]
MYDFLSYRVSDYMTTAPKTVGHETPLRELQRLFDAHDFNGVPVVDEQQRLLGLATKLDLLKAFTFTPDAMVPRYDAIMERPVHEVMTREPITVPPDLPLTRVLQRMVDMRTKGFPVVDDEGRVVGVIAREDLLGALRDATSSTG